MKSIQKQFLFFTIVIITQFCYSGMQPIQYNSMPSFNPTLQPVETINTEAQNNNPALNLNSYLYRKNSSHADLLAAHRLTEESYITPEMQWALFSFLGNQGMIINKITGAVQGIPSVEQLLPMINQQMQQSLYSSQKDSLKNALHAMLEATEIAIFVASIEAAYQDPKFILYQDVDTSLTTKLKTQQQSIQTTINNLNAKAALDQPVQQSSYFSWLPSFGSDSSKPQPIVLSTLSIPVDAQSITIAIPAILMPTIVKTNDYKETSDYTLAANLLFKQCFIAQQHHLKDIYRMNEMKINLQGYVGATNYIFNNFPNLYNKENNRYPICEIAQNLVALEPIRYDLQSPTSATQQQAHQLLIHIRQAIQTALYIANKKSNINFGYLLPTFVTSYLDGIVSQLTQYDAKLNALCKEPQYGATPDDTYQDEQRSMVSKIAAGTAITAAGYVAATSSSLLNWVTGALTPSNPQPTNYNQQAPAPAQTGGWLSGWFGK